MPSLENLLQLTNDFLAKKVPADTFIEEFQEIYFNERVFENIPENIKEPMDNIVLAVGLTNTDDEARDPYGPELSEDGLRHTIEENLALIEKE